MKPDRVNARLPESLSDHVAKMVGTQGYYETPSEYIRDLIRHDMEKDDIRYVKESIINGYKDISAGRHFKSTGSFAKDRKRFAQKEAKGWK